MTRKQVLRIGAALTVCGLVGFAVRQTAAQRDDVSALKVDFHATDMKVGRDLNPVDVEEGTYWIAPGRHRMETRYLVTGEHIAEIVNDADRHIFRLDLKRNHALVGTTRSVMPPIGKAFAVTPPGVTRPEGVDQSLGEKTIDGLTMEGVVTTFDYGNGVVHSMETWYHRFSDARVIPVILETRFDSPDEVYEKRVTHVATALVSPSLFEVPADFETTKPNP